MEKINDSDLEGLKVTSNIDDHISILERSVFNLMAESSAKNLIDEFISSTISLMNTKNIKCQRIDPCGTSAFIKHQSDEAPGRTMRCILSFR